MTSQPPSTMAFAASIAPSFEGKPAGRYPISAARFSALALSYALATPVLIGSLRPRGGSSPRSYSSMPGEHRSLVILRHEPEVTGCGVHVLVTAAGQAHDDRGVPAEFRTDLDRA